MQHEINTYNVRRLFTTSKYRIPIYQRNYAWGEKQIQQLIDDIYDLNGTFDSDDTYFWTRLSWLTGTKIWALSR